MYNRTRLRLQALEEREVPAAAMFADIMPGIWGSYPLNLTPSGNQLFFSADNGHGYELYVTDGTPGSAHMVKDIKPGLGGSNPTQFEVADGGVIYFTADDGTGAALWRSDGSAAGTIKVPGMPPGAIFGGFTSVARDGVLYFIAYTPGTSDFQWWKTNGTTTTLLKDFGPNTQTVSNLDVIDGKVVLTQVEASTNRIQSWWVTDGTPGGTRLWQQPLTVSNPTVGQQVLGRGTEIASGLFVHAFSGVMVSENAALWVSDGVNASSAVLLKAFDTPSGNAIIQTGGRLTLLNGKAYFTVASEDPAVNGLWVTNGTTAGTTRVSLPGNIVPTEDPVMFDGRLFVYGYDQSANRTRFWLTDGTPGGTQELFPSAGAGAQLYYRGQIPPGPEAPHGALIFQNGSGQFVRTDGTASGTAWIDPTGLPSPSAVGTFAPLDGAGRAVAYSDQAGVYFHGGVYFQAPRISDIRPELWKWDVIPPAPQVVTPHVESIVVNDGAAQRSMVTKLTITFDREVHLGAGAITLKDATGQSVQFFWDAQVVGGKTVLTWGGVPDGAPNLGNPGLADGRYTLTILAEKVSDTATGGVLEDDITFEFTRLFGDLNGDGSFDREARWMAHEALGTQLGDPGYIAALDYNADGFIDASDEIQVVRRWGKSV